jgi:hypothetical protein
MNWRAKLRNPKIQQYILEILFPLLGYYFWNWSLLIIIVFYLLDYLGAQLLYFRRLYFIQKYQNMTTWWLLPLSVTSFSFFFFVVLKVLSSSFLFMDYGSVKPYDQLIVFAKDELWFLFPILILTYYMMDNFFFYMPRRFMNYKPKKYLLKNIASNALVTMFVIFGVYINSIVEIKTIVIILIIIMVKFMFDFLIKKSVLKINN